MPDAPLIRPFGPDTIAAAAALIREGEIVAVPTETVYGLAADATNPAAVMRIYEAKGRPSFNPLIVHVNDLAAAERLAIFDTASRELAERFWPGPLTLVLPLRPESPIAPAVTAGLGTVAIGVRAHRALQALITAAGLPLAAPSANASNGISPTRAEHVAASLGARVPLIIDDGACQSGLESTIVMDGRVIRPGPIPADVLGLPSGTQTTEITAPGQLARHYSPAKALRLNAIQAEADEWLIGYGPIRGDDTLSATGDPIEAAARLFAALHRADASAKPRIAIAPIPESDVGEAINDRLRRAAHR